MSRVGLYTELGISILMTPEKANKEWKFRSKKLIIKRNIVGKVKNRCSQHFPSAFTHVNSLILARKTLVRHVWLILSSSLFYHWDLLMVAIFIAELGVERDLPLPRSPLHDTAVLCFPGTGTDIDLANNGYNMAAAVITGCSLPMADFRQGLCLSQSVHPSIQSVN